MTPKKSHILLILGTTLLIHALTFSQTGLDNLDTKIDSLRRSGIDTFLSYTPFQNASAPIDKGKYLIVNSSYLIWFSGNTYHIQKFSNCLDIKAVRSYDTTFKPLLTGRMEAYQYFLANINDLKSVRLKPAMVEVRIDGKDTILKISSHHAPYTGITIFTLKNEISNSFTLDELNDGIIRNNDGSIRAVRESLNYKYNVSTSIYKLTNFLSDLIALYEKENTFDIP